MDGGRKIYTKTIMENINPYIGPRSYTNNLEDQIRFFGRVNETDDIISLILGHRLSLVYSASGVGKTSIFNAKIIPVLEQEYKLKVLPMTRVGIVTSNEKELTEIDSLQDIDDPSFNNGINIFIFNALQDLKKDKETNQILQLNTKLSSFLKENFSLKENAFVEGTGQIKPQVLIFDQFEELFKFNPGIFAKYKRLFKYLQKNWYLQKKEFFNQITEALNDNPSLRIVFVMREDYLAELNPFSKFLPEMLKPRYRLERLRKDPALSAIRGPLQKLYEDYYEKNKNELNNEIQAIVEELLKIRVETHTSKHSEIVGEYIEPIQLQVVCDRWWRERHKEKQQGNVHLLQNSLKIENLKNLINIDNALEDFYEEAVEEASKETGVYEGDIRIWIEKKLITTAGTRSFVHRESRITSGIPNKVLEDLEKKYLIRGEERYGGKWYELSHDRFITPILNSNKNWKENLQKKLKTRYKNQKRKTIIIIIIPVFSLILLSLYSFLIYTTEFEFDDVHLKDFSAYAVNPNTNMIYVGDDDDNTITVINGTTNSIHNIIKPLNYSPDIISINANTNMIYVGTYENNTISLINGTTNTPLPNSINLDYSPEFIYVNPSTNMVYIGGGYVQTLFVLNGTTNTPIPDSINLDYSPDIISVNPTTNMIYVGDNSVNNISIINGTTNTPIPDSINLDYDPDIISVNPNTNMIYVGDEGDNTITVINGTTNTPIPDSINLDYDPDIISVNPNTNMIYVGDEGDNTITVINGTTNTPIPDSINLDYDPDIISVNPNTNMIYVGDKFGRNTVSVINGTTNENL